MSPPAKSLVPPPPAPAPVPSPAPATLPRPAVAGPAPQPAAAAATPPAQTLVGNAAVAAALGGVPPADGPALMLLAGQPTSGNGAVAAAGGLAPPAPAPAAPMVRRGPHADPKFVAVKKDVRAKGRSVAASHPPAKAEAGVAQAAARPPADDKVAQGKTANADKMDAAKPREFDKAAFIRAVEDAIAKRAPENLKQADEFGDSGKAEEAKREVQGRVGEGKDASAAEIATTTAAPPDTSKAVDKKVVPLVADKPPPVPGAPNPGGAVPDKLPPSATDMSAGPAQLDRQMASAQVTEPQLAKSNEPQFVDALGQKNAAERDSVRAQTRMRAHEKATLAGATADAQQLGAAGMQGIAGARVTTGRRVGAGKTGAKGRDEAARAQVTATLQRVFDATKKDVEDILSGLDRKVDEQFSREEKAARDAFTAEHKRKMADYKDRRYAGAVGKLRWFDDWLTGLPDEANQLFVEARDHYISRMRTVIANIADTVAAELNRAKRRIADGRAELQATITRLPAELQSIGKEAAADFADKFDELTQQVDDKGTELVDTLAEKYTEALKSVDEEIAAEKEKNKGAIDKAKDAVAGVVKTIIELKNLLLGVLRKAAQAVMAILNDPIGFLRNLVASVGAGLKLFLRNIGKHLQTGLLSWLLGVSASAGIQFPAKFDVRGIVMLIASLLGLTWANIRSRIVRKVPEPAVAAAETAVPLVVKAKKEGVGGLWEDMKARIGDLKQTLISKVTAYLIPTVIMAGIIWVLSLLNPASAFVRACKLIIDIIRFIVERGRQVIEFVDAVLDAVIAIARGSGGGVPALIEKALARSIPVLIGFLAAILGIGGIANRVKKIFQELSKPVNKAVDWVIDKIIKLVKKLWAKLRRKPRKVRDKPRRIRDKLRGGDDSPAGQLKRLNAALAAGASAVNRFRGRPVAGKVLEPLLAVIRIRHGLAVLRPVVVGDHWAVYGRVNPDGQRDTQANVEGAHPTGVNPNFTADAKAFERKLAAKAARHPAANSAMARMAKKAKAYIRDRVGGRWHRADQELARVLEVVGHPDPARSGFVGVAVANVMAVFDEGTLAERFVHIVRFFTEILGRDLLNEQKQAEIDEHIAKAKLKRRYLEARREAMRAAGLDPETASPAQITRGIAPIRPDSDVQHQTDARIKRDESHSREIGLTVERTGLRFSSRQEAMQRRTDSAWDRDRSTLNWMAGMEDWMANERHEWVQKLLAFGLPLGAGPSGTTNTMMSAAQALGAKPYPTRLACIAFLIGARHHSLIEIMVAAEPFGCTDLVRGQQMYRHIEPLTEAELRACGIDGRFPDEPAQGERGTRR